MEQMTEDSQKSTVMRMPTVLVGMLFGAMLFVIASAAALSGVRIVNPVHGNAKIKGEDARYYYYGAKIMAEAETTLIFKQAQCSVSDKKGKKYSQYWVHIAGASAGLSFTKRGPLSMKTLGVELEGGESSGVVQWNTSMIDGPEGALEFKIPKGGYVVLNFLWEVPKDFSPSRAIIGDLIQVPLDR